METGSIVCVQGTFFQRTGDGPGAVWQDMTWDGMFLLTWNQIARTPPASAWRSSDERPRLLPSLRGHVRRTSGRGERRYI